MIDLKLKDDQYEFKGVDHTREVIRAILVNEDNKILLEKIVDNDMFGPRDYYETPGGGAKKNETHLETLKREIAEECGYLISDDIVLLGKVKDYYNLINRENHNYYYIARVIGKCEQHLEADELRRIAAFCWVDIDEAITLYENMQNVLVGKLVKQRELPILKYYHRYFTKK